MWSARRGKNTGQAEAEPNRGQGSWGGAAERETSLPTQTRSWASPRREIKNNDDDVDDEDAGTKRQSNDYSS